MAQDRGFPAGGDGSPRTGAGFGWHWAYLLPVAAGVAFGISDFLRKVGLDETLESIDRVTIGDLQRISHDLLVDGPRTVTVLGPSTGLDLSAERLGVGVATVVE